MIRTTSRNLRAALLASTTLTATLVASSALAMGTTPGGPTETSHPEEYCADREGDGYFDPTDCTFFHVEGAGAAELFDMPTYTVFRRKNQPNLVDNCPNDSNYDQLDSDADGVGDLCEYADLTVGGGHACAIRGDGAVSCWGDNEFGQASAPMWTFSQVTTGRAHSCGLLKSDNASDNGRILCWGDNSANQLAARNGQYVRIRANGDVTCAVDKDGVANCWGSCGDSASCNPLHTRKFSEVTPAFDVTPPDSEAPLYGYCGVDDLANLTCFNGRPPAQPPAVKFMSFDGGDTYGCGIQPGGRIHCFKREEVDPLGPTDPMLNPPVGQFSFVSVGRDHACAVGFNRQLTCWGANDFGKATPPSGQYDKIAVGDDHSCARATTGKITCWGDTGVDDQPTPNALEAHKLRPRLMQYQHMSANEFVACGVTFKGRLNCSNLANPNFKVPDGKYYSVHVGEGRSCARRQDGKTVCWSGETGETEEFTGVSMMVPRRYGAVVGNQTQTREYLCGLFTNSQKAFCRDEGRPTPVESDFTFGPRFKTIGVMGERQVCGITVDGRFLCQKYQAGTEVEPMPGKKFEQLSCNNGKCCAHDGFDGFCYDAFGVTTRVDKDLDRTTICRVITNQDPYPLNAIAGHTRCFDEFGCTKGMFNVETCLNPPPPPDPKRRVAEFAMGSHHGCTINNKTQKPRCFSDSNTAGAPVAPPDLTLDYLSSGTQFACGVKDTGIPVCWGSIRREIQQLHDFAGRLIPTRIRPIHGELIEAGAVNTLSP